MPQVPSDRAESAGEDQQRRPALQEQLRAALRDDRVVAAQDQNRVGLRQLMIEVMVVPECLARDRGSDRPSTLAADRRSTEATGIIGLSHETPVQRSLNGE